MKTKIYKNYLLAFLGYLLMSFENISSDNAEKAKLVFLHERAFWGDEVELIINNKKITNLHSNHYVEIEIDASNIDIIIDRNNHFSKNEKPEIQANLSVEPKKVYYLKIYREIDYFTNKLYLVRISEQTAKKAMKSMKLEQNPLKNE